MNFGGIRNDTSGADLLKIMERDRCFVVLQHPDEGLAHVYLKGQEGSFPMYVDSQTVRRLLEEGLLMRTEPDPKVTGHLDKLILTPKGRKVANET
jgi:hypothetical protein